MAKEVKEENKSKKVSVYSKTHQFVRSYSEDEHGAGFQKLAEEFAAKKGHYVK